MCACIWLHFFFFFFLMLWFCFFSNVIVCCKKKKKKKEKNTGWRWVFNLYFLPSEEDEIFLDIFFKESPSSLPLPASLSRVPGNAGIALKCGLWPRCCHRRYQSFSVNSSDFLNLPSFSPLLHSTHFFSIKKTRLKNDLYLCDYMECALGVCLCSYVCVFARVCVHLFAPNSCSLNGWTAGSLLDCSQSVCLLVCLSVLLPTRAASSSF